MVNTCYLSLTGPVLLGLSRSDSASRYYHQIPAVIFRSQRQTDRVETMTRVLLYSNEPILAKGLESVLRQTAGFDPLQSCNTVANLKEHAGPDAPDLLLIDLTPEVTFGSLSEIRRMMPNSWIVLWVNSISTELAFQAMGLGVRGILRKKLPPELQVKCLQKVQAGELWFEKALTDSFLCARRVTLTRREGELTGLVCRGLKNKEIAAAMTIEEGTVKVYLSRLFQKVGVRDRFELALYGLKNTTTEPFPLLEKELRVSAGSTTGLRSLVLERPVERITPVARRPAYLLPVAR